jgi:hypothetical protein
MYRTRRVRWRVPASFRIHGGTGDGCRCSSRYRLAPVGLWRLCARLRSPTRRIPSGLPAFCPALVERHHGTSIDSHPGSLARIRLIWLDSRPEPGLRW